MHLRRIPPLLDQRCVDIKVVVRHASRREPLLEAPSHLAAVERQHAADLADRLADGLAFLESVAATDGGQTPPVVRALETVNAELTKHIAGNAR